MVEKLKQYKTTLIAIGAIIVLYFGYVTFAPDELPDEILLSDTNNIDGSAVGEEIIVVLNRVKSINFRTALFDEPLFASLVDRSVEPTIESKHRRNPFEPFGFGVNESGSVANPITIEQFVSGDFEEETVEGISDSEATFFLSEEDQALLDEATTTSTSTEQATTE